MNIDTGSLSKGLGEFATGSAGAAPKIDTGSATVDFLPQIPGQVLQYIADFVKKLGF